MSKKYRLTQWGTVIGNNLTFEELKVLMLTLNSDPTYQERVKNSPCATDNTYESDSLRYIAACYETIGSVREN